MVSSRGASSDDDEEEQTLHFKRLSYDAQRLLEVEGGSCLAVHDKFLLVGTQVGNIHILDHQGNRTKTLTTHTTPVSHISIDEKGEHMASCAETGDVAVHGTASQETNISFQFNEPVYFCVLHPHFSSDSKRRFVIGTDKIIYYQRNFFNHYKTSILHQGEGAVRTCSWNSRFAAFATDISVVVFDMTNIAVICKFKRDQAPTRHPEFYPSRLAWMDERQLLVGWADRISLCNIKDKMIRAQSSTSSFYLEISSMFTTDDIFVCGLAPFGSNIAILGTEKLADGWENTTQMLFQLLEPHNKYCTQLSSNRIPLNMTSKLRTNFMLNCLTSEQRFFILSNSELVVIRFADKDEHIDRLIGEKKYEEAMQVMVNCSDEIKRHGQLSVGKSYLNHLLETERYAEVGPLAQRIFGSQTDHWEDQVFSLANRRLCYTVAHYIPCQRDKKLSSEAYEIILNEYIHTRPNELPNLIRRWRGLYSLETIQNVIEERFKYSPDVYLEEAIGLLKTDQGQYADALDIFLKIGLGKEAITLLHNKFDFLKDRLLQCLLPFMKVDHKEAAMFLAKHNYYSVKQVSDQLRHHKEYLLEYLLCKFTKDPQALDEGFHDLLMEHFATDGEFALLQFFRKSNKFSLEKALEICEKNGHLRATAYLYERMGSLKKALAIITEELRDVEQAIEFCKDQDREDLWTVLTSFCVKQPDLLTVLLSRIGNYIDPTGVIEAIPPGLQIPNLRDSLVRILHDFKLQIALRGSSNKIFESNRCTMFERLHDVRRKGISVTEDAVCEICNHRIVSRDMSRSVRTATFACKHTYHMPCLEGQDELTCYICQKKNSAASDFSEYYNN
ncbi:vacuolar protein sorting-associated protein 41 homolog isoform X2 [Varroa jacobsoni]|nr:vacuolar protein sorting-associated protein 41 homolog isoform X2 [Varroa jacobsoni]XP_022703760.1 vacuolar protein sorting-associated protein 41 homolog isoform X2 [Varroa jacobsoni]